MSITFNLYRNFDGTLDGRYKQGDKPAPSSGGTPALAWSAPSGLVDGETLTITTDGTYNFGTKANAKPLFFADFNQSSSPSALGRITTWLDTNNVALSGTVTTPNSSQSLRWDASAGSAGSLAIDNLGSPDQLYIFRRFYDDFDIVADQGGSGFNLKRVRVWRQIGGDASNNNNIYHGYQGSVSKNPFVFAENTTEGGATYATQPTQKQGQWLSHEYIYQCSTLNTQNGIFDIYENGVLWEAGNTFTNITTERPNKYNQIAWDQVSNGTAAGPLYMYIDQIYIDDSYHRAVIAAESTWASVTKTQPFIPTSWTTTTVSTVVKEGEFDLGSSLYLYVVDGSGTAVNSNGVAL